MAVSSLSQRIIAEYLQSGNYDRHLKKMRQTLSANITKAIQLVTDVFPAGTRTSNPAGGFVLWIEMSKTLNSNKLQLKALENRINISPGTIFSPSSHYLNCFRLNCGTLWSSKVEKAIITLGKLAKNLD